MGKKYTTNVYAECPAPTASLVCTSVWHKTCYQLMVYKWSIPKVEQRSPLWNITPSSQFHIFNDTLPIFSSFYVVEYFGYSVAKNDLTPFREWSCLCLRGYRWRSCVMGDILNRCVNFLIGSDWCLHEPIMSPVPNAFWATFPISFLFSATSGDSFVSICHLFIHMADIVEYTRFKNRINTNQLKQ